MAHQLITSIYKDKVSNRYDLNLQETLDALPIKKRKSSFLKQVCCKLEKNVLKTDHDDSIQGSMNKP